MAFFVRLCDDYGGPVSSFQKSLFRNLIALFIALVVFLREKHSDSLALTEPVALSTKHCALSTARSAKAKALALLLLRSAFGCAGIFGNFYALSKIPIGEAMTLNKTAPFFAVIGAAVFLGEKLRARTLVALAIAFTGAMLVMKPGFQGADTFATLCAIGGGLGAGLAYTCVRELGVLKVRGSLIVLFFSAFSSIASLPFLLRGVDPMTPVQLLIMLGAGAGAAIGQFGVTAAYRFAAPGEIAVFDYSNVIFTSLLGLVFLGQIPDALSVAGFALIVLASLYSRRQ